MMSRLRRRETNTHFFKSQAIDHDEH
jgi:hypothetical protein